MRMQIKLHFLLASLLVAFFTTAAKDSRAAEEGRISAVIHAGSYEVQETSEGHFVFVEEFGRIGTPGLPDLPAKIFAIAVPPGAEVKDVTFEAGKEIFLPGDFRIPPAPLPVLIGQEDPAFFVKEKKRFDANYESVYGRDEPFPNAPGRLVRTAAYRKYNLVDVQVFPFSYLPESGRLAYRPEVTVHVDYTLPGPGAARKPVQDNLVRTENRAREIVFNYEQSQRWYPATVGSGKRGLYDFVIITLDYLTSAVQPLVDCEVSKGRTVNVVTTNWIQSNYSGYDLAERMRNFLRDKYPSGEWGIEDVCLVGHYDDVPMRRCWQDIGYGKPETDYYYAELSKPDSQSWDKDGDHKWGEGTDPIDFYAEVNVGRIPWSDIATVEHICKKSAAYEENVDPSYKKNILLLGAFFWPDTDNAVLMEYKTGEGMHPWMSDWQATRLYEQGHSKYPMDYDLTYSNVKSVWSGGKFAFVDMAGHGSPTGTYLYYSGGPFVDTGTCASLNDDYPAIIFADACSNSDTDYDNLGQMMMKQGAVGFLGATKVAFGMPGWKSAGDGSSQSLDYYFTTCVTSGSYTQGEGHQWALRKMYTDGLWYFDKYEMFEWGALWGNPDIRLDCNSSLWADNYLISVPTGGVVNFTLEAGAGHANRSYLLLGSLSGTSPGFNLPGGLNVPLNWDAFTNVILANLGTPAFTGFMGNLDASGSAAASFDTLGPLPHAMAGLTGNFAYMLGPPPAWDFVSNTVSVKFIQ